MYQSNICTFNLNSFLIFSVFNVRNLALTEARCSDQFIACEKFAPPPPPPHQYSEPWPPQYSKSSYAYASPLIARLEENTKQIGPTCIATRPLLLKWTGIISICMDEDRSWCQLQCWKRPVARWPNAPCFCLGPPEITKLWTK